MSTSPVNNPIFVPASPRQIAALHKAVAARGIHRQLGVELHEAVRQLANVGSLTAELSTTAASRLLDQLNGRTLPPSAPRSPRARAGILRPATPRQRACIAGLFAELGWSTAKAGGWLLDRHDIADLATATISTRTASAVIVELQNVLMKGKAG
jgi:hypothetical protein